MALKAGLSSLYLIGCSVLLGKQIKAGFKDCPSVYPCFDYGKDYFLSETQFSH